MLPFMPTVKVITGKRVHPDDQTNYNKKFYCRLSFRLYPEFLTEEDWENLQAIAVEEIGLDIREYCEPGGYYAHWPSLFVRGHRLIVHQSSGLDV